LMALGIYNYSNQSTEIHTPKPTISEKKIAVKETEKVSVVTQKVKEKESSVKNITVKSPKVISKKLTQELVSEEETGKDITLESIDNASDEEKRYMRDEMAYSQSVNSVFEPTLDEEEILKIMEDDMKSRIIK